MTKRKVRVWPPRVLPRFVLTGRGAFSPSTIHTVMSEGQQGSHAESGKDGGELFYHFSHLPGTAQGAFWLLTGLSVSLDCEHWCVKSWDCGASPTRYILYRHPTPVNMLGEKIPVISIFIGFNTAQQKFTSQTPIFTISMQLCDKCHT